MACIPVVITLYFTLDRFGRKWSLIVTEGGLGATCLMLAFLPKDWTVAVLIVYSLGKMFSEAAFLMVYLVTLELYPTSLRTQEQ
jgi:MFS family permease